MGDIQIPVFATWSSHPDSCLFFPLDNELLWLELGKCCGIVWISLNCGLSFNIKILVNFMRIFKNSLFADQS